MRDRVERVIADARIQLAFRFISSHESEIESDQVRLTLIPSPPFGESERAEAFSAELLKIDVRPATDAVGNVIAPYEGAGRNPLVIAAHLDTVFPSSVVLQLRRDGRILRLPGISDNGAVLGPTSEPVLKVTAMSSSVKP